MFVPGVSLGCFFAGYTFHRVGSSASFRLISYAALLTFFFQVLVNQFIKSDDNNIDNTYDTDTIVETKNPIKCVCEERY